MQGERLPGSPPLARSPRGIAFLWRRPLGWRWRHIAAQPRRELNGGCGGLGDYKLRTTMMPPMRTAISISNTKPSVP